MWIIVLASHSHPQELREYSIPSHFLTVGWLMPFSASLPIFCLHFLCLSSFLSPSLSFSSPYLPSPCMQENEGRFLERNDAPYALNVSTPEGEEEEEDIDEEERGLGNGAGQKFMHYCHVYTARGAVSLEAVFKFECVICAHMCALTHSCFAV